MFTSRVTRLSLYSPKILCECTRNARKGVTVMLKKVKPPIRKIVKETYSPSEFKQIRRGNPGIAHNLIRNVQSGYERDVNADPEDFLDTDLDAFDAKYLVGEHKRLAERDMKKKHFHNIKRKYFKEDQLPNMISYIEKQQISHLHKEDPETWTVDKLAESFPASPAIIKKVLRANFTLHTVEAVQKHDKKVRQNWDLFRKGELHFDPELESHYAKFSSRLKFETNVNEIKKFLPPPPDFSDQPIQEFSEIITSSKKFQKLKEIERKQIEIDERGSIIHASKDIDVHSIEEDDPSKLHHTHFTLDEFRKKLHSSRKKNEIDSIIIERAPNKSLPGAVEEEKSTDGDQKLFDLDKATGVVDEKLPYSFQTDKEDFIALKINIPKHLWRKDKLYRIKDCFYNDEGIFLYRVPGLF